MVGQEKASGLAGAGFVEGVMGWGGACGILVFSKASSPFRRIGTLVSGTGCGLKAGG